MTYRDHNFQSPYGDRGRSCWDGSRDYESNVISKKHKKTKGATMTPEPHPPTMRAIPRELYDRVVPMLNYLQTLDISDDDKMMLSFVRGDILGTSRVVPNPDVPTTSAEKVLEQIEKIIFDRIQELKYPKSHDCVREALLGENQALWAQIQKLRQQGVRE